jgi:Sporulation and spore germination
MRTYKAFALTVLILVGVGTPVQGAASKKIKLFFIILDDNGKVGKKIGCGDSIIPVAVNIAPTSAPLKAAYETLLAIHDDTYGARKLSNPLSKSNLRVDSVVIKKRIATIRLTGDLISAGHCEDPRIEAQLTEIALQFPTVRKVSVFVNGVVLRKLLSGQ